MKFYGRESQKKQIQKVFMSGRQETILIYGRRRIGKSELIKQCLREAALKSIYYECKQTTELNNVESLAEIVSENFGYPRLAFHGMEELLKFLYEKAWNEKMVLVLDEYPYLRENVKGMDSILQALIDGNRDNSGMKLIICGSYVDTMKSLLSGQNPLFGRVDLTIDLKPMDYYESSLFYAGYSNEDKVRLFSVLGGVPYYNRLVDQNETARENIVRLIASPGARLENEVSMYLSSEISRITNANEVFEALAKGFSRYKDILDQSHVSSGPTLVDVLDKLIRMEMVKKETPINDEHNKKKTGYFISDQLCCFYYKYIFRNASRMNVMDAEFFCEKYIWEDFETRHVPKAFEEICRQYLIRMNRSGRMEEPFERIGKYYFDDPVNRRNGEFDIVTLDDRGYVFYEAKFRKERVTDSMIREEMEQVRNTGLRCYKYGFISRSGFSCRQYEDVVLIDMEQLFR